MAEFKLGDALKQFVQKEYGENALAEPLNFFRIMDWVSSRWVHDGSISSSTMNTLEILKAAKSGRKFSLNCPHQKLRITMRINNNLH